MRKFMVPALGLLLALGACGKSEEEGAAETSKPAAAPDESAQAPAAAEQKPIELSIVHPVMEQIVEPVVGTGTITATQKSNIGPTVSGVLEKTFVSVGDRVKQGDPLFEIRQNDYITRLEEAQFQVKLAEADFTNAKSEFERISELKAGGVVSKGQMDKIQAQYSISEARLGIARANLAKAKQALDDTVVRAPYDGVIVYQYKYNGEFLSTMGGPAMEMGGGGGAPGGGGGGRGVFDISKIDIVAAIVEIPETKLRFVRLGTPGTVRIDGMDKEYPSQVHVINDQVDPVSRKVQLRLAILNPDYAIKPGLFARATLTTDPRPAITLDRRAVLGPQDAQYVFLAVDGRAKQVKITGRELDARRVEILQGLTPEDRVLIGPNLSRVRDGDAISVEMAYVD
ncbi:MAG TPA: efflux RND transporter periplasmic adaptor subunit [Alphaproteobacteria bacterium]|nr:efflux RND transporter periplasmic adaptor subunit [Alphaproteobacteria bacterium]